MSGRAHWVGDRTFGWMMRWRCLVRDYEARIDASEAMTHVATVVFCADVSATGVLKRLQVAAATML
jgi:hypothetical protein